VTGSPPEEEIPVWKGPDPRLWQLEPAGLWDRVLDVRAADEMVRAITGEGPQSGMSPAWIEACALARKIAADAREHLAGAFLDAYGVTLPEEEEEPPDLVREPAP
jgi:hypothetical protein